MSVSKRSTILAVDDMPDNLVLLDAILSEFGHFQVDLADSGKAAIALIEQSPPDLVLMDVMMPEMDGYEVTRRIRQNQDLSSLPILLLTAHDAVSEIEGLQAGANGFLRKPFDIEELLEHVQGLL